MEEFRSVIKYELVKEEFTTPQSHKPRSSLPQLNQIKFNFVYYLGISNWILPPDSSEPQLIAEINPQKIMENSVCVSLDDQQTLCFEKTRRALESILMSSLPVDNAHGLRILIDYSWNKALRIVRSNPIGQQVVNLHLNVFLEHQYYYSDQVSESSGMIPTADSSIEGLKRVIDSGNMETICSICLEDLSSGGEFEALSMPCSHIFHGDCIKKWLSISHYCPVCRHQMPTELEILFQGLTL